MRLSVSYVLYFRAVVTRYGALLYSSHPFLCVVCFPAVVIGFFIIAIIVKLTTVWLSPHQKNLRKIEEGGILVIQKPVESLARAAPGAALAAMGGAGAAGDVPLRERPAAPASLAGDSDSESELSRMEHELNVTLTHRSSSRSRSTHRSRSRTRRHSHSRSMLGGGGDSHSRRPSISHSRSNSRRPSHSPIHNGRRPRSSTGNAPHPRDTALFVPDGRHHWPESSLYVRDSGVNPRARSLSPVRSPGAADCIDIHSEYYSQTHPVQSATSDVRNNRYNKQRLPVKSFTFDESSHYNSQTHPVQSSTDIRNNRYNSRTLPVASATSPIKRHLSDVRWGGTQGTDSSSPSHRRSRGRPRHRRCSVSCEVPPSYYQQHYTQKHGHVIRRSRTPELRPMNRKGKRGARDHKQLVAPFRLENQDEYEHEHKHSSSPPRTPELAHDGSSNQLSVNYNAHEHKHSSRSIRTPAVSHDGISNKPSTDYSVHEPKRSGSPSRTGGGDVALDIPPPISLSPSSTRGSPVSDDTHRLSRPEPLSVHCLSDSEGMIHFPVQKSHQQAEPLSAQHSPTTLNMSPVVSTSPKLGADSMFLEDTPKDVPAEAWPAVESREDPLSHKYDDTSMV